MGKKDIVAKKFLSDNRRFADLCNYYFFDGRQLIQPKDLEPLDTAELVSIDIKEDLTDMCKAWDDHKLSGIREGKTEKQIEYVIKLLCKGFSAEQTADILGEPQDTIRHIYDIAASVGPDYDIEKIYKELTHTALTV